MKKQAKDELTPEQLTAIDLLTAGKNDTETAQAAGVTRQTVWAWRNDDYEFIAELNRRRADIWNAQTEKLRNLASQALGVLGDDLVNCDDPKLRQAAAVHILRAAGRYGVADPAPTAEVNAEALRRESVFNSWHGGL